MGGGNLVFEVEKPRIYKLKDENLKKILGRGIRSVNDTRKREELEK
ncbi:hypothetical protein [Geosporobacter subterraneus]|nr:hypothetical protein [Geosporobacter subterraneus]